MEGDNRQYENFDGGWVNDKYKLYIFTDGVFFLWYEEDGILYKRNGKSIVLSENEVHLKTRLIQNEYTNTRIDNDETIRFKLADNNCLKSEDLDIELKKKRFDPYK